MTITRPLRLMILHFSQIFLTDGLTFTALASFRLPARTGQRSCAAYPKTSILSILA